MKKTLKFITVLTLLVLMNCASNVKTKTYTNNDFSNFKTFAYLPNTTLDKDTYTRDLDKSVEASLIEVMNDKMIERGFTLNNKNPDLLVILTTSNDIQSNLRYRNKYTQPPIETKSTNSNSPNYATVSVTDRQSYSIQGADAISNRPYKEGSLVIEVFDKESKELAWVGIAENYKAHISDQTLMSRMINDIFEKFPE